MFHFDTGKPGALCLGLFFVTADIRKGDTLSFKTGTNQLAASSTTGYHLFRIFTDKFTDKQFFSEQIYHIKR